MISRVTVELYTEDTSAMPASVLMVRRRGTNTLTLPGGPCREREDGPQAAARCLYEQLPNTLSLEQAQDLLSQNGVVVEHTGWSATAAELMEAHQLPEDFPVLNGQVIYRVKYCPRALDGFDSPQDLVKGSCWLVNSTVSGAAWVSLTALVPRDAAGRQIFKTVVLEHRQPWPLDCFNPLHARVSWKINDPLDSPSVRSAKRWCCLDRNYVAELYHQFGSPAPSGPSNKASS